MTYKHIDFGSSEIMRSLEKVAQEKGLIKADPIKKTAAVKLDLTPSNNLTDNILKLCAGLRAQGRNKYAEELENNFLNYKKAQTLYETSKEKGEDLINSAHPKGSHKLEDVNSKEAVFENILDQHLKTLEVVNKKPTGKLSNASIIKSVKTVLGQQRFTTEQAKKIVDYYILKSSYAALQTAREGTDRALEANKQNLLSDGNYENITHAISQANMAWKGMDTGISTQYSPTLWFSNMTAFNSWLASSPGSEASGASEAGLNAMINSFNRAKSVMNNINSESLKTQAQEKVSTAIAAIETLRGVFKQYQNNEIVPPYILEVLHISQSTQSTESTPILTRVARLLARIDLYISVVNNSRVLKPQDKKMALEYLNNWKGSTDNIGNKLKGVTDAEIIKDYNEQLVQIEAWVKKFHDDWKLGG